MNGDRVIGQRRRPAVGEFRLVRQDHVRPALSWEAERRLQLAADVLGDPRQPGGQAFLAAVEVDDEVFGRDAPEAQTGIEPRRRRRRARPRQDDEQAS